MQSHEVIFYFLFLENSLGHCCELFLQAGFDQSAAAKKQTPPCDTSIAPTL